MNVAVVPAKNEQGRISRVLTLLKDTLIEKIIVVVNGSRDNTMREIKVLKMDNTEILYFTPELGVDIPRAIGAYWAFQHGATCVVFVDGDLIGNIRTQVNQLISAITSNEIDIAMTDCYRIYI